MKSQRISEYNRVQDKLPEQLLPHMSLETGGFDEQLVYGH